MEITREKVIEYWRCCVCSDDPYLSAGAIYALAAINFQSRCNAELEQFRELTKKVPFERLKELADADSDGLVLTAEMPIGTVVYQLNKGEREETRIIDGEAYTRKVPDWYVTHHEYSWIDAMVDAEHPERREKPHCRYYLSKEEACAERDRINAGGDPYGGEQGEEL